MLEGNNALGKKKKSELVKGDRVCQVVWVRVDFNKK